MACSSKLRSTQGASLEAVSERHNPVSYTHLDVYKRQLLYSSTHAACTFSHLVAELPRLALGFTAERSRRILDSATDLRSGLAYGVGRACDLVLRSL